MKAPFKLLITANEELLMINIEGKLCASLIIGDVDHWDDEKRLEYLRYIVRACNVHKDLLEACKEALPLIEGERIRVDSFPPTTDLEKMLDQAVRKAEIKLLAAIDKAEGK